MGKRSCGSKDKTESVGNDIFFKKEAAEFMFDFLFKKEPNFILNTFSNNSISILDACCGSGILGESLEKIIIQKQTDKKIIVDYLDIKQQNIEKNFYLQNILLYNKKKYNYIVCNPPWQPVERALLIYQKLKSLLDKDGVLFFIINIAFVNTNYDRGLLLCDDYFSCLPRYTFKEALENPLIGKQGLCDPVVLIYPPKSPLYNRWDIGCNIPIPRSFCYKTKKDQKLNNKNQLVLFN